MCLNLYEHRVLTTHQVFELHFEAVRRAQRRLLRLHNRRVLERFRPFRPTGSYPWHYILGDVGITVVAAHRGVETKELKVSRDRLRALAYSPILPHLVAVNGFFSRLAYRCRGKAGYRLAEWWSERRATAEWQGLVRPDGIGRLRSPFTDVRFFFELDRGTEPSSRLEEKLAHYARVARIPNSPRVLLFLFPTERREAEARKALVNPGMVVLTGAEPGAADPLGSVWLPVGGEHRLRLDETPRLEEAWR